MKSILESNLHQITNPNGDQAWPEYDFRDGEWFLIGHEFLPRPEWATATDFGGTFSKEETDKVLAASPDAVATPLTVDQLKSIVISEISDVSKDVHGSRLRLSSADYTLAELEEELETFHRIIRQEREAEEKAAHEKMLEANRKKDERRAFNKSFGQMTNAFAAL